MTTTFADAGAAQNMRSGPGAASYSALRLMQIEEVRRKGGFTYLRTEVNGVDVFEYEQLYYSPDELCASPDELCASPDELCASPDELCASPVHTCELRAWNFVVPVCTCESFQRTHLPCAHCEALQLDLWESLMIARAEDKRRAMAREGCWAESPVGSGSFVWLEEFALTSAEIRNIVLQGNHQKSTLQKSLDQKSKAQRRGNATGLTIERTFRHAHTQYTS